MTRQSFRTRLRAFQAMQGDTPDPAFITALEFLENRDLDLSVRIGGLLAFNALMVTIGTHPVSASPGAPLSLDAATQPVLTILSLIGIAPLVVSSVLCLRALLLGEEFDTDGLGVAGLGQGNGPPNGQGDGPRDCQGDGAGEGEGDGRDDGRGEGDCTDLLRRRLFAAFIHSIDTQSHLLRQSVIATLAGGAMTLMAWAAILWDKMV